MQTGAQQQALLTRNAATAALVILAGLILVGLVLLVSDVNRRILVPCADAARANMVETSTAGMMTAFMCMPWCTAPP